ncbi:MAG: YjcQ family protein [Clostridiales bacterium]|nr:YjcQ family protein [Clostridiales bacterium]
MLWNDYFVVVYRILSYLYDCLKKDEKVNREAISPQGLNIVSGYWMYILEYLQKYNRINDISLGKTAETTKIDDIEITPKGIIYLFTDPTMKRAKEFIENELYSVFISDIQ